MSELIMRVQTNKNGAPNFATAEKVQTKPVKYFDEEDKTWKMGEVIADHKTELSCDACKLKDTTEWCKRQEVCRAYQPKDKPQTERSE